MFDLPEIMRMAQGMARHASARQGLIAENIAHANTPGFRARDLPEFGKVYMQDHKLQATRPGHLDFASGHMAFRPAPDSAVPSVSPNGNTVSLEREMMRATLNRQAHDMALAIYGSARTIMRTSLGK
ncbi:MAG: FlgB family protein [Roseinatronobacter sp.]